MAAAGGQRGRLRQRSRSATVRRLLDWSADAVNLWVFRRSRAVSARCRARSTGRICANAVHHGVTPSGCTLHGRLGEGRHIALRIRHIHHDVSSSAVYLSIGAGATVSAAASTASVGTAWRWRVRGQPIRLSTAPANAGRAVAVDATSG